MPSGAQNINPHNGKENESMASSLGKGVLGEEKF